MNRRLLSRRSFLQASGAGLGGIFLGGCSDGDWLHFFSRQFRKMSAEEIAATLRRHEKDYLRRYGKTISVTAAAAAENTLFGFGIDLSKCIGCRQCVTACVRENNITRNVQIHYIRVIRMEDGQTNLVKGEHYYAPDAVPEEGFYYLPAMCMQCENPPCVKVCPVNAMWREPDGIVVVDYDWCIGCRDCMAACPYRAIKFNWNEPQIPADEFNTETDYLSNRPRVRGVVEKCHGCLHRTRKGLYPACVEACPTGALVFGNLLDPGSTIRFALERFRTFRLKEELNTGAKCFYFFSKG